MKTPTLKLLQSQTKKICVWISSLVVGAIALTVSPSQAAERISFNLGLLQFEVSVQELEDFAKKEQIGKELDFFVSRIGESDRQYVRKFLTFPTGFTALQVSQFFYSDLGEKVLGFLGDFVQPHYSMNGARAIRAGLILAAADSDGLTALNFFKKFPTSTINLNGEKGFKVMNKFANLRKETEKVILGIEKLSAEEEKSDPKVKLEDISNLAEVGQYMVKLETETLKDIKRDRKLIVDFYFPQGLSQPAPVIVLSHGLASDRQHFASLAKYLASYGFIAAVLEHPGSSTARLQMLLKGLTKQVFDVDEFIERPKDVSFILDDLAQRFPKAVNVEQSGIIGHSLGGYTALALAGATIDFNYLTKECIQEIDSVNISLILQCEALKLPRQSYQFRDQRIKFALAINPVDSSIFGPQGMAQIKIPVAIAASSEDIVASVVLEQIKPFSWLNASKRYLFVVRGVGHVSDIQDLISAFVPSLSNFIPDKNIQPLKEYSDILILALVQTYVANRASYLPYLRPAYANVFSQPPNKVSILRSLTPEQFSVLIQ
jgi:predicted dienelactone hydrolase